MSKMKMGLGKGLDALINPKVRESVNEPVAVNSEELKPDNGNELDVLVKVPVSKVVPNPYQPRTEFNPEALEELRNSILENGLIQPITVRRGSNGNYELISGERRLRACSDIGYREIPAYIIKVDTPENMIALALIENIQREDLNPIEVADSYQKLITECKLTQEEIAKRVGKNRTTITNSLRLLKLPEKVRDAIASGKISAGHARALINLESDNLKLQLLDQIISKQLSVRKVEKLVRDLNNPEKKKKSIDKVKTDEEYRDDLSRRDIEAKLRTIFATKVSCKQKKDGSGAISIEFYSNDELDRLFELFELIDLNS
jgi:ParB family chromosome partitioning protein